MGCDQAEPKAKRARGALDVDVTLVLAPQEAELRELPLPSLVQTCALSPAAAGLLATDTLLPTMKAE